MFFKFDDYRDSERKPRRGRVNEGTSCCTAGDFLYKLKSQIDEYYERYGSTNLRACLRCDNSPDNMDMPVYSHCCRGWVDLANLDDHLIREE